MTSNRTIRWVALAIVLPLLGEQATAQSAIEHHVWEEGLTFRPYSRTAESITGPIRISDRSVTFGRVSVPARRVGRFWRDWAGNGSKHTADVFKLSRDPGTLRNGNTLCGKGEVARYFVVWEALGISGALVETAVWSSALPPTDINSEGLCATLNYLQPTGHE